MKPVSHNQRKTYQLSSVSTKKVNALVHQFETTDFFDNNVNRNYNSPDTFLASRRSCRQLVLSNPLLDAISAIEDYCDYDDFSTKTKKNDIHIDSDSYIGYVGSNSIDSGYKSTCSTPEMIDKSYYSTASSLDPGKRLSLISRGNLDSLPGMSGGTSKPRIAMGTRVMSRQNTSGDIRRRHDSGFDDKSPGCVASAEQNATGTSLACSTNESKIDSVRRSSLRLKSRIRSECGDNAIRPRSASIGSLSSRTIPFRLSRSESNDVLRCNSISDTSNSSTECPSPVSDPTHAPRKSPKSDRSRFWHLQTRRTRAPLLLSNNETLTPPGDGIANILNVQDCRTERNNGGRFSIDHLQPSTTSKFCQTDMKAAQLIGNKIEISGTEAPPALPIPDTRSRIPATLLPTFSHRPTQIQRKVCLPLTGSVVNSSQREERNIGFSTSANPRSKLSHKKVAIGECNMAHQSRPCLKPDDSDIYHTYEEVMYSMMHASEAVSEAKQSPLPPPLPLRPTLMKKQAHLTSKSSAGMHPNMMIPTLQSRRPENIKRLPALKSNIEAPKCHQEPKQRHNLYSLLHSARQRRCLARSLEKPGSAGQPSDEDYGFVASK